MSAAALSTPKVRQALIIMLNADKVVVTEQASSILVTLLCGSGIERSVTLTVPEARALTDHLNRIRRRIVNRPEWQS